MSRNTATGAKVKQERKITFKNKEHEKFYKTPIFQNACVRIRTTKPLFIAWDFQRTPGAM